LLTTSFLPLQTVELLGVEDVLAITTTTTPTLYFAFVHTLPPFFSNNNIMGPRLLAIHLFDKNLEMDCSPAPTLSQVAPLQNLSWSWL
jgi:hypothetical protein